MLNAIVISVNEPLAPKYIQADSADWSRSGKNQIVQAGLQEPKRPLELVDVINTVLHACPIRIYDERLTTLHRTSVAHKQTSCRIGQAYIGNRQRRSELHSDGSSNLAGIGDGEIFG